LRECDRVSTHFSILLLLLLLPDFLIFSHLLLTKFPAVQACGRNPFADSAAAAPPEFLIMVCCSTKWVESGGIQPGRTWISLAMYNNQQWDGLRNPWGSIGILESWELGGFVQHGPAKDTVKEEVVVTDRTTLTKKLQALLSELAGRLVGKQKDDAAEILSMVITCLPSVSSFSSSSSLSLVRDRQPHLHPPCHPRTLQLLAVCFVLLLHFVLLFPELQ
jgi:hypothetical protein